MSWNLRHWAQTLTRDVHALYLACGDPRVPWYAKALAIVVVGYALSPIDLIPDFIPVLGLLDDLVLLPAGLYLVLKFIPSEVLEDHRRQASAAAAERPTCRIAAVAIVAIWALSAVLALWAGIRSLS